MKTSTIYHAFQTKHASFMSMRYIALTSNSCSTFKRTLPSPKKSTILLSVSFHANTPLLRHTTKRNAIVTTFKISSKQTHKQITLITDKCNHACLMPTLVSKNILHIPIFILLNSDGILLITSLC